MVLYSRTGKADKIAVLSAESLKESADLNLGHSLGKCKFTFEMQLFGYFGKKVVKRLQAGYLQHLFNILLGMRKIFHLYAVFG